MTPTQESNVRALLPLASASCETGQWRVKRLFRDADASVIEALEALGYYNVRVAKKLHWEKACWRAEFTVDPGQPVRLRTVDFELFGPATKDRAITSKITSNKPQVGDILNHGHYESYRDKARNTLIESGYFDAVYTKSHVLVDTETLVADLTLHLNSGPRYQFGDISYTDGILRKELLVRYTDIVPGDFYNAKTLTDLSTALSNSGYFDSVSVSTETPDPQTKTVPVTVRLTPGNRHLYTAGIGFSTDIGPQGRLGYTNRRRSENGSQFESRLFVSPIISETTASYRWPRHDPRKEWFSVAAGFKQEDTDTSESDAYRLGISRGRSVAGHWLEKPYLELTYEDFSIGGQDGHSRLLIAGINWASVTGRELGRITQGRALNYDLRGAGEQLGSDTSFLQLRAQGKWIRSLGAKTRALLRANIGATLKDSLSELPPSVRFFAGGDRSVRGYDFESIGPRNSLGKVIGGAHLLEASIEVDYIVHSNWAIAAFVDSGSAFSEDPEFFSGAGVGLRWHSPVGPIRLDLATPLDNSNGGIRIHISMGPDL